MEKLLFNVFCFVMHVHVHVIISPNEVFGDIMVLASRPPVDPDDVKALSQKVFNRSLSNLIWG